MIDDRVKSSKGIAMPHAGRRGVDTVLDKRRGMSAYAIHAWWMGGRRRVVIWQSVGG